MKKLRITLAALLICAMSLFAFSACGAKAMSKDEIAAALTAAKIDGFTGMEQVMTMTNPDKPEEKGEFAIIAKFGDKALYTYMKEVEGNKTTVTSTTAAKGSDNKYYAAHVMEKTAQPTLKAYTEMHSETITAAGQFSMAEDAFAEMLLMLAGASDSCSGKNNKGTVTISATENEESLSVVIKDNKVQSMSSNMANMKTTLKFLYGTQSIKLPDFTKDGWVNKSYTIPAKAEQYELSPDAMQELKDMLTTITIGDGKLSIAGSVPITDVAATVEVAYYTTTSGDKVPAFEIKAEGIPAGVRIFVENNPTQNNARLSIYYNNTSYRLNLITPAQ